MGFLSGLWEGISFLASQMNFEKLLGEDRCPSGCIKQLSDLPLRLWVAHFHHLQLLLQNRANATAMVIHAGTLALVFADILVLSNLQHVRILLKYRYAIIFCMCRLEHNYKISSTTDRFHLQLSAGKLQEIMLEMFNAQCTLSKVMKLTSHALNHVCFDFCATWLRLLNKWLQQNICLWKKRWSLKGNVPVKIPKKTRDIWESTVDNTDEYKRQNTDRYCPWKHQELLSQSGEYLCFYLRDWMLLSVLLD